MGELSHLASSLADIQWSSWGVRVVASGTILLLASYKLRKLHRGKAIRVPHPNKRVADGEPEVIIVGSGILGSSLAAALGKDGRRVTVIERNLNEPERIVGEFLQPGGVLALQTLGLEDCLKDIESQQCRTLILRNMDSTKRVVKLPWPEETPSGYVFHHCRFVQQLRNDAFAHESVKHIEGSVLELLEEDGATIGVRYRPTETNQTAELKAPLVVVADGIHSKFRKNLSKEMKEPHGYFCGVLLHDVKDISKDTAELVVADPSFLIIFQTADRDTRVHVDLPPFMNRPGDIRAYLKEAVPPVIPGNMVEPFLEAVEAGRYSLQQTNYLPATPLLKPGVIQLGDALNMRHPLTGSGMTAALNDSVLTRDMLRNLPDLYDYSKVMNLYRQVIQDRKTKTFSMNVFSVGFYHAVTSPDYHMRKFRRGLMDFADIDGFCKSGMLAIFTTMKTQTFFLLRHLFLSALWAMALNFKEAGVLGFPVALFHNAIMVTKICRLIGPYIWSELKTF